MQQQNIYKYFMCIFNSFNSTRRLVLWNIKELNNREKFILMQSLFFAAYQNNRFKIKQAMFQSFSQH